MFKDLKKVVMDVGKKAVDLAAEAAAESSKKHMELYEKEAERRAEQEKALREFKAQHIPTSFRFKVDSNYHGGYPGQPNIIDGGALYLTETEMVWVKNTLVIHIPYTDMYDLDLTNSKASGDRSRIESANDVHQQNNTVVVICCIDGIKQRVKFEIWGAMIWGATNVHGGALNAQKVMDHLAAFRGKFAREQTVDAPAATQAVQQTSLIDELQKLAALYEKGLIDADEFKAFKQKLINAQG